MTILYLVRHGETIFNVFKRMQGWCDTPLSEVGIQQARNLGKGLSDINFDLAYASSSGRSMQTASYILENRNIKCIDRDDLREMYFGTMEGLDIQTGRLKDLKHRNKNGWSDVGGENYEMLAERIHREISYIAQRSKGNILVVSHGVSIMEFIRSIDIDIFNSINDTSDTLKNCAVTKLNYENGVFKIIEFNNINYLKREDIK